MIFIFVQPNFTFNGIYSKDMNICIATMNNDILNDIGIKYSSSVEIETNLVEYSPYFIENSSDTDEIELNLLLYNSNTSEALSLDNYNIDEIYDWLLTDNFAPFISDDNKEIIYYFKATSLTKVLTFDKKGYLRVTFKPYSKYCYKRYVYIVNTTNQPRLEIYNYSRLTYKPIINVTNLGDTSTINTINNMEIIGLETNQKIKIDNLTKLVLNENNENCFNHCNAKWIELSPRSNNTLNFRGNCLIEIICEFPILY